MNPYTPMGLVVRLDKRHAERTGDPACRDSYDAWAADIIRELLARNDELSAALDRAMHPKP